MGCNAWNHSRSCNCGWGGGNYSGYNHYKPPTYSIEQTQFSSFTIPNATCPICGDSVFYYENEYGSKVWFDSLGPPWPIHGCFEGNNSLSKSIQNQKQDNLSPINAKVLNPEHNISGINNTLKMEDSSLSKVPCIIQKNIKRSGNSYITAKIFDVLKQQKTIFLILDSSDISAENHICFIQSHNINSYEIFYFDTEKMQHGNIKATAIQNRKDFLFLAKHKQKNADNLEKIRSLVRKVKKLQSHTKIALADWLYSNTVFDNYCLSIFSGLNDFEINQLVNDKLKSTHTPQSPIPLKIIDDEAFSFLIKNTKCIHTVL